MNGRPPADSPWTQFGQPAAARLEFRPRYLRITGRDRNGIKSYIGEEFDIALCRELSKEEIDHAN